MSRNFWYQCLVLVWLAAVATLRAHAVPVIENNGALAPNIPESAATDSQEYVPLPLSSGAGLRLEHRSYEQEEPRGPLLRLTRSGFKSLESGLHQLFRMFMSPISTIHRRSQVLRRRIQENRNGNHLILKRSVQAALTSEADSPRTLNRIIPAMQQGWNNFMDQFFLRGGNLNAENKESPMVALRFTSLMRMFPALMQRWRNGFASNYNNSNRKIYHIGN